MYIYMYFLNLVPIPLLSLNRHFTFLTAPGVTSSSDTESDYSSLDKLTAAASTSGSADAGAVAGVEEIRNLVSAGRLRRGDIVRVSVVEGGAEGELAELQRTTQDAGEGRLGCMECGGGGA